MKIAILGARGFVGSELTAYLKNNHNVVPVTRDTIDLLNPLAVRAYLEQNKFDIVINAAAVMTDASNLYDTRNNLGIYMNFFSNAHLFKRFINLASGAEYDRSTDINAATENLIFQRMPQDSYGFGQNVKSRLSYQKHNFYNLRIFNCFGAKEASTRLFSKFISKQTDPVFEIQNDRYFDYFSIQDLCKVVEQFITKEFITVRDVNCVYPEKFKISQVLDKFCQVNNLKSNFVVVSTSNNNYTGNGDALTSLGIALDGLEKGFKDYVHS